MYSEKYLFVYLRRNSNFLKESFIGLSIRVYNKIQQTIVNFHFLKFNENVKTVLVS